LHPGLANARPRSCAKLDKAPGTDKVCKCPEVARGGVGGWVQLELTDALFAVFDGVFLSLVIPDENKQLQVLRKLGVSVNRLLRSP